MHSRPQINLRYDFTKIVDIVAQDLSLILDKYDINYKETSRSFIGSCPIHEGDNKTAFNIFKTGRGAKCNWVCYTHQCHQGQKDILGLIVALEKVKNNQVITRKKAVDILFELYKIDPKDIIKDNSIVVVKELPNISSPERPPNNTSITRELVCESLDIPSKYFLRRGFSNDVLCKFDIGDCNKQGKAMYKRAVVPFYDEDGNYVGCSGRSYYNKCVSCGGYHPHGEHKEYPKWKNSRFEKIWYLYGLNLCKQSLIDTGSVILVESPGNLWRLHEAGFFNSVALFGNAISDFQIELLCKYGVSKIYLMLDNDDAGKNGTKLFVEKCAKVFKIYIPHFEENDIGNMSIERVQQVLKNYD